MKQDEGSSNKADGGFVLLRSLLSIALVLVCAAALFAVLASALRQNTHLEKRLGEEFLFREKTFMEKLK